MAGSNEADRVNSGKRGVVQRKECSTLVWLLQVPVVVQAVSCGTAVLGKVLAGGVRRAALLRSRTPGLL